MNTYNHPWSVCSNRFGNAGPIIGPPRPENLPKAWPKTCLVINNWELLSTPFVF